MAQLMQQDAWISDWNDIVRNIIFKDATLKELMMLPKTTTIIDFYEKYFIRTGTVSTVLKDETVRINYTMSSIVTLGERVGRNLLSFDIYVKDKYQHNYSHDALTCRTELIALRLRQLLLGNRYNGVYRFYDPNEGDMNTSTIGYARYNLTFSFTKIF